MFSLTTIRTMRSFSIDRCFLRKLRLIQFSWGGRRKKILYPRKTEGMLKKGQIIRLDQYNVSLLLIFNNYSTLISRIWRQAVSLWNGAQYQISSTNGNIRVSVHFHSSLSAWSKDAQDDIASRESPLAVCSWLPGIVGNYLRLVLVSADELLLAGGFGSIRL